MACFLGIADSDWLPDQEAGGANLACSLVLIVVLERLQFPLILDLTLSWEQDLLGLRDSRKEVSSYATVLHIGKQTKMYEWLTTQNWVESVGPRKRLLLLLIFFTAFFSLLLWFPPSSSRSICFLNPVVIFDYHWVNTCRLVGFNW